MESDLLAMNPPLLFLGLRILAIKFFGITLSQASGFAEVVD